MVGNMGSVLRQTKNVGKNFIRRPCYARWCMCLQIAENINCNLMKGFYTVNVGVMPVSVATGTAANNEDRIGCVGDGGSDGDGGARWETGTTFN